MSCMPAHGNFFSDCSWNCNWHTNYFPVNCLQIFYFLDLLHCKWSLIINRKGGEKTARIRINLRLTTWCYTLSRKGFLKVSRVKMTNFILNIYIGKITLPFATSVPFTLRPTPEKNCSSAPGSIVSVDDWSTTRSELITYGEELLFSLKAPDITPPIREQQTVGTRMDMKNMLQVFFAEVMLQLNLCPLMS